MTEDRAAHSIRIARIVPVTEAEGPGRRTAIWTQGCSIRCPGCFNPHLFTTRGGTLWEPYALAQAALATDTEGITLLGGEPFDQPAGLAATASLVRAAGRSVMTFTGFTWVQIQAQIAGGNTHAESLVDATDLLVTGPFIRGAEDERRPWLGSTNQEFHFLSPRYMGLRDRLHLFRDRLELRIDRDGSISANGWATDDQLDELLHGLGRRPPRGRRQID